MNPPPLDMKQAQEYLRGAQQQLQACIELRRAASMRIQELEAENAALRTKLEGWLYCYIGLSVMRDSYNFDEWIASEDSKSWREDMALAKGVRDEV